MGTWELVARERIRDTLIRYHWWGDAGRIDELTHTFCPDGELEIRGVAKAAGRQEIATCLRSLPGRSADPAPVVKRIVRHSLTNTRFLELTSEHARVDSYFTVATEIGLDHFGRYRDVLVPHHGDWLIRSRFVSTDWRAPDSTMAPPSAIT